MIGVIRQPKLRRQRMTTTLSATVLKPLLRAKIKDHWTKPKPLEVPKLLLWTSKWDLSSKSRTTTNYCKLTSLRKKWVLIKCKTARKTLWVLSVHLIFTKETKATYKDPNRLIVLSSWLKSLFLKKAKPSSKIKRSSVNRTKTCHLLRTLGLL